VGGEEGLYLEGLRGEVSRKLPQAAGEHRRRVAKVHEEHLQAERIMVPGGCTTVHRE